MTKSTLASGFQLVGSQGSIARACVVMIFGNDKVIEEAWACVFTYGGRKLFSNILVKPNNQSR